VTEFTIDWKREQRTGIAEAVLCAGKRPDQIAAILVRATEARQRLFLTRLDPAQLAALPDQLTEVLDYDPHSRTAILGESKPPTRTGDILIVTAGTSDLAVAQEASRTLFFNGLEVPIIADVGVAGLWRLIERLEELRAGRIIIAVAGMEAALFSVLAGLVAAPVIAVPSSVGYGVAAGGQVALNAALASCAPGVLTVNIDNGFGAAVAALKCLRAASPRLE
jgi:hypothetical protein